MRKRQSDEKFCAIDIVHVYSLGEITAQFVGYTRTKSKAQKNNQRIMNFLSEILYEFSFGDANHL